jgi:hypothetical protein
MFSNMMKWLRGKKSPDLHSYQQETSLPRKSQIQPGILETFAHSLQILNITHSWYNMFAWLLKPVNFFLTYYRKFKVRIEICTKCFQIRIFYLLNPLSSNFSIILQRALRQTKPNTSTINVSSMEKILFALGASGCPISMKSRKT